MQTPSRIINNNGKNNDELADPLLETNPAKSPSKTIDKMYQTVVVGYGPVGLAAALVAASHCEASERVAILADRRDEKGVRQQVLWIQEDVYNFLKKYTNKPEPDGGESNLMDQLEKQGKMRDAGIYPELLYLAEGELVEGTKFRRAAEQTVKMGGYYITTGELEALLDEAMLSNKHLRDKIDIFDVEKIPADILSNWQFREEKANPDKSLLDHASPKYQKLQKEIEFKSDEQVAKEQMLAEYLRLDRKSQAISVRVIDNIEKPATEQQATVKTISFQYLVAADGARRSLIKALSSTTLPGELAFGYTQEPLDKTKHVVATFHLKGDPVEIDRLIFNRKDSDPPLSPVSLDVLKKEYGWNHLARPFTQIYAVDDIIYIGAELPASIAEDRKKSFEYAKLLLRDKLPESVIKNISEREFTPNKFGKKQELLAASRFDLELGDVNISLLVCTEEDVPSLIFIMGDALKNPLYTTGTGVQTGLREVMAFDKFLNSPREAENVGRYHADVRALTDPIHEKQNKWVLGRLESERQAKKYKQCFDDLCIISQSLSSCVKFYDEYARTKRPFFERKIDSSVKESIKHLLEIYNQIKVCNELSPATFTDYEATLKSKGISPSMLLVDSGGKEESIGQKLMNTCDKVLHVFVPPELKAMVIKLRQNVQQAFDNLKKIDSEQITVVGKQGTPTLKSRRI